ncbi:MAG: response regulator [Spirochaetota bacterium]
MGEVKKVLYAEDEYTNGRLIQILLNREGIQCDLASDGRQALNMYNNTKYDLIILDYHMPVFSGVEVAKRIRLVDKSIPIIGITSDEEKKPALQQVGFTEIFIKPLHNSNYLEVILSYLKVEKGLR